MPNLNANQKKAAEFKDGACCVIATPGSGKTLVLTERICHLINHHDVSPEHILGLTFTRNAAQEMKERLAKRLNGQAPAVTLSTIHGFSLSLLKDEGRTFEIVSDRDQLALIKKAMAEAEITELGAGEVLRHISLAKSNLVSAEEFEGLHESDPVMGKVAETYRIYDAMKRRKMLMDFDDLLVEANWLLDDDATRKRYRQRYRHILVDEFQDSNLAQVAILKQLAGDSRKGSSLWVSGDDMQSIYGFNGANVSGIVDFNRLFPGAKRFILNLNYRSKPPIITACRNLMKYSSSKIKRNLRSFHHYGGNLVFVQGATEEDEADQIATEITNLMVEGYMFDEISVLYRSNFQLRALEEVFAKHEVPYRVEGGSNFFKRPEIRPLLDYVQLIVNPDSEAGDEALKRIINVPNRYVGNLFLKELEAYCATKGCHLFHGLRSMSISVPYLRRNIRDFIAFLSPLIRRANDFEPSEMIYLLRENLDYDRFVINEDKPSPDDTKIANLNQLQLSALKHKDPGSFLKYTQLFEHEWMSDPEGVSLMTIHKAKGLEFRAVFVAGLVDGILPNGNGDIEEERRICFVAVSRAKEFLCLSHSETFMGQPAKPSPFLEEIKGVKKVSTH
jgi:DNA helicase-2/ATP-dependent DNA helicase PcrA